MQKVDIENTQARLLVGPACRIGADGQPQDVTELRFIPGMNHMSVEAWNEVKCLGSVPTWIKLGWLREHGETPENIEVPPDISVDEALAEVSSMKANEVVAAIEGMGPDMRDILEAIAERDNRQSVSTAAKLQLDRFKTE